MMRSICAALAVIALIGCDDTVGGQKPVLSDEPDPVEMERFARRLHLDLTGKTASDGFVDSALSDLSAENNSVAARAELADDLLSSQGFADTYVAELDNQVFGGESSLDRYNLLCINIRNFDPACQSCPAPSGDSLCSNCACPALVEIEAERLELEQSAADLGSGDATSSEIDRRFAESRAVSALSGPEGTAQILFETFLGRLPEGEETRNAVAMITGLVFSPDQAAGLLFQRHGSNFDDMVTILFESEIYREARVNAVFERYLGRAATPIELRHLTEQLSESNPDIRPVVGLITSSGEYFNQ